MPIRKVLLFIISLALLTGQSAFAQAIYSVKAKAVEEKTDKPVAFATASVMLKGEKTPMKYALTDGI